MPGRLFRPRWKPPRRGCPPRAASGFRRLPGGRTRSGRNGPIRADATAASCFACRNSLLHSPFASLPGRFSGRIAGPAALPLGGRDSAGGQPGSLVAGTVRAACELGPGAGCEGRESDGNGLEWARIRPGTDWNGRESGREQPGGYLLRLGKKLGEHLCPGSGRRLGASASRPEETAPGAGRSTLLAAASHSGSFATRWATIQQRHNSAMLHSGGSEPNDSALRLSKNNPAIRRCRIPEFAIR